MFVNLIAIKSGEGTPKTTARGSSAGNLRNPLLKPSPFGKRAKGTGEGYEIRLSKMIENTLKKGSEIARWHEATQQMGKDGIAQIGSPVKRPTIDGKPTVGFDLKRRTLLSEGQTIPQDKVLWVRADLAGELRQALNVDSPHYSRTLRAAADLANRSALASLTEAMYHTANQISALVQSPGTGTIIKPMFQKAMQYLQRDPIVRNRLVELARMGATKEPDAPMIGWQKINPLQWTGRAIKLTDRIGRLVLDDAYTKLVARGLEKETETGRRDFVNRFGQYNIRGQHRLVALVRQTGLGPFATAGTNFYALAAKSLAFSPGLKGSSVSANLQLRGAILARYAAIGAGVALANYLKWGRFDGGNNTPYGAIRLDDDENGKTRYFDVLGRTPLGRGLRETGLKTVIEDARSGQLGTETMDKAVKTAGTAMLSPFEGPLVRDLAVGLTGYDPSGFDVAEHAPIGQSQAVANLKAMAVEANPIVSSLMGNKNANPLLENQLGPFAPRTARAEQSLFEKALDARRQQRNAGGYRQSEPEQLRTQTHYDIVDAARLDPSKTDQLINDAIKAGTVMPNERSKLKMEIRKTPLQSRIGRMEVGDIMDYWKLAEPAEKAKIGQFVRAKINNSKATVQQKQQWHAALDAK